MALDPKQPPAGLPPPLEPGQRAPNFALPTAEGRPEQFYDRFVGQMVLLLVLPSASSSEARQTLAEMQRARETLREAGVAGLAMSGDTPAAIGALASELALDFPLYADAQGAALARFGLPPGTLGVPPRALLIDRNQRLLEVFEQGPDLVARVLEHLSQAAPARAVRSVIAQAPVLLLPNVLTPALCEQAIAAWQADNEEGLVNLPERAYEQAEEDKRVHAVYFSLKKRRDHVADDTLNAVLMQAIMSRLKPELAKAFRFQPGGLERVCIGAYEAERGDYFRPHRDNTTETTKNRCFAVSIALNQDYEGGGVRFAEFGPEVYDPPIGGALVFSCSLLHEALPVTRGTRFAAFTFLLTPDYRGGKPFPTAR